MRIWPITLFFRKLPQFLIKTKFDNERVAFFSYYYSGNAKPIYQAVIKEKLFNKPYWVLMVKDEVEKLRDKGIESYYYKDSNAIKIFLSTPIWVSTHVDEKFPVIKQKNFFEFLKFTLYYFFKIESPPEKEKRIIEMQLWHGLGFKAWRKERKRDYLVHADIYCFTSEHFKKVWMNQFKIDPERFKMTGYARHDLLINKNFDESLIKKQIGIEQDAKIILFAPTWEQRKDNKSIYYWNFNKIEEINDFCEKNNVFFIFRTHHMQKTAYKKFDIPRLKYMPVDQYPDTISLLAVTDILITDWSSIANDYIFLNRPTIFIDTPNPFDNDFSLLPEDRAGYILKNHNEILNVLDDAIHDKNKFTDQYKQIRKKVLKKIYNKIDGKATERCINELKLLKKKLLNKN